jgi:uncharacterized membrane protein
MKLFGHPIHQMLIVFPLGLLATAAVFDLFGMGTGVAAWPVVSYYLIGAGIVGGLIAAVFGLFDWLQIPSNTRAKALGGWHGVGNVIVVLLFAGSFLLRREGSGPARPSDIALGLSFSGVLLALVTGWLGGELVDRLGIGVDEGANPNAPSSLTTRRIPSSSHV